MIDGHGHSVFATGINEKVSRDTLGGKKVCPRQNLRVPVEYAHICAL